MLYCYIGYSDCCYRIYGPSYIYYNVMFYDIQCDECKKQVQNCIDNNGCFMYVQRQYYEQRSYYITNGKGDQYPYNETYPDHPYKIKLCDKCNKITKKEEIKFMYERNKEYNDEIETFDCKICYVKDLQKTKKIFNEINSSDYCFIRYDYFDD